jgi:hypothetical protein
MCRRALASPEGQHLVAALRRGIVVLLAAPFMLFGIVAMLAIRSQRRRHGIRDATDGGSPTFCRVFGTPRRAPYDGRSDTGIPGSERRFRGSSATPDQKVHPSTPAGRAFGIRAFL